MELENGFTQTNLITNIDDEYGMVIISSHDFSDQIQPLIDRKNTHGVQTIFKSVDDIHQELKGRDEPEQIKYFIKYTLESWNLDYVLFI